MSRCFIPVLLFLLIACGGAVAPGGGSGGSGAPGPGGVGGPLDANLSGAQPLSGGFPAPSLEGDPGKNVFSFNFLDRFAECFESTPGQFSYRFEGFVVPAVFHQSIAGRILRLVDPNSKVFLDVELTDKTLEYQQNSVIWLNYTGYFYVKFSGAYPLALKGYLLASDAAKDALGKILPCASDSCPPAGAAVVEGDFMDGIDGTKLAEKPSCMLLPSDSTAPLNH